MVLDDRLVDNIEISVRDNFHKSSARLTGGGVESRVLVLPLLLADTIQMYTYEIHGSIE